METTESAIKSEYKLQEGEGEVQRVSDVWSLYLYALKSPITKENYGVT